MDFSSSIQPGSFVLQREQKLLLQITKIFTPNRVWDSRVPVCLCTEALLQIHQKMFILMAESETCFFLLKNARILSAHW